MDITLVHWFANAPDADVSFETYPDQVMPLHMRIGISNTKYISLFCMTTDSNSPHIMEDECIPSEKAEYIGSVVIGLPASWNDFAVITWLQSDDGMMLAFHNDPIPPSQIAKNHRAGTTALGVLVFDLSIETI